MDLELQIKSWFALNDKLVNTGEELLKNFSYFENNQRKLIYEGFLRKGINSLKAIQLLTRNNYLEQANILTRSLMEDRVSFDYFYQVESKDSSDACQRVRDAMILDKLKQLESTNYYDGKLNDGITTREKWEGFKEEINRRYTNDEIKAMSKYGFSGISVEERFKRVNLHTAYNEAYRIYSKNVHTFDILEQSASNYMPKNFYTFFESVSKITLLYASHVSSGGIIKVNNTLFGNKFLNKIESIEKEHTTLRSMIY